MNDEEKIKFLTDALEQTKAQVDQLLKEQKMWLLDKPPTKLMAIPALMEAAGWVRKKEWVGLTGEERAALRCHCCGGLPISLVEEIEAKLKEKNT